jgi:energy-coupling factor transport system ATP-binding protein
VPPTVRRPAGPPADAPEVGPAVVTARGVGFGYEDAPHAVHAVDLALTRGERVALVGPNGSGKSTLGRLLAGLLRPAAGEVRLRGRDPHDLHPRDLAGEAVFLFQDPEQQFVALRVEDEITLGLDARARRAAAALMDRIELPLGAFGDRSPYTLSGGEQRRLSLATALVRHPALLVLDEPTFGMDRRGHDAVLEILGERVDEGAAVLAATHDERFVAAFARRIVRMEAGRIVAVEMAGGGTHASGAGGLQSGWAADS